jgi:flagellar basal-body rod protein FlgG
MSAQQTRLDTISNNLANVATSGYKRSRAEFQDLFYETIRAPGASSSDGSSLPTGVQIGSGVRLAGVAKQFAQGDAQRTDAQLDLMIQGDGFFQIEKPTGETLYTRDGSFKLDRDGNVVTSEGFSLTPNVQVSPQATQVTILRDGTVSVLEAGNSTPVAAGQIELARFANPAGMVAQGSNFFVPSDASGDATTGPPDQDGMGSLAQGFLEASNVNVAEELVQMILAQRAFELNSRVIQAGDEMLRTVGSLYR